LLAGRRQQLERHRAQFPGGVFRRSADVEVNPTGRPGKTKIKIEMKYLIMMKLDQGSEAAKSYEAGTPPPEKLKTAMMKLMGDLAAQGKLVDATGLAPVAKGAKVRATGGKLILTDGPFIESKEVIGGYAVIQVDSREEALKTGREFMQVHVDVLGPSYEGELEIREMLNPGGCGQGEAK
jgi:hypothetical protein